MKTLKSLFFAKSWFGVFFRIGIVLSILAVPFRYHFKLIYIDGISMNPTYDDGQWTLMQRCRSLGKDWKPERFDVVVILDEDNERICKRIIGLPGETLEIVNGLILVNNKPVYDSFGTYRMYDNVSSTIIQENHVWVIGDHRYVSHYGHFPIKNIHGKIILY